MSDALLRSRLIRLASENPSFRKELLPILAADDDPEEDSEEVSEEIEEPEEEEEEETDTEAKGKKASTSRLAAGLRLMSPADRELAMGLVRLAKEMPEKKDKIMGLVTASLREVLADYDPKAIGEKKPGPIQKQPDEPYMGVFIQNEFSELREKQQGGNLAQADKFASEAELRRNLIRLASSQPKGSELRTKILSIVAGCEKLPEGPMRDNCNAKKEEGKENDKEGK